MSLRAIQPQPGPVPQFTPRPGGQAPPRVPARGHAPVWDRTLPRRHVIKAAVGAAGLALAAPLVRPATALAQSGPRPIPGGERFLGPGTELFHVFLNAPGFEQSVMTDFDGLIASMHAQGTGTGTDTKTGQTERLLFDADMRLMIGTFRALDGTTHRGSFGFIWLDAFRGAVSPDHQLLDFNPGFGPEQPFWTIPMPAASMGVDLATATAFMTATNLAVPDYRDVINALLHGPAQPGVVSYDIRWRGRSKQYTVRDAENGYAGGFTEGEVSIAWSGEAGGYRFVSDPANTSESLFAIIGHERNGAYFS